MTTNIIAKGKKFVIAREDGLLLDSYMHADSEGSGQFTINGDRKHFWNKRGVRFDTQAEAETYNKEWFAK